MMQQSPLKRILVVEDEADHAELIQRGFEDASFTGEVVVASTLRAARELLATKTFDILLVDYRLPDGEGHDLVREFAATLPTIMMTSHGSESVAVEVMKSGALDYIVKGVETFATVPRVADRALREWTLLEERKLSARELRESENRYRTLFAGATEGIVTGLADGRLLEINQAFADMHGYTVGEMRGMILRDLDPNGSEGILAERIRRLAAGETLFYEVEHRHKSGRIIQLEVSARRMSLDGQDCFVAFHRDVTERKAAAANQAVLERQLQQTQKLESMGVLAGGIAHDFNNLLTIIFGNLSRLEDAVAPDSPGRDAIARIDKASRRAAELCRQMLAYAGKAPAKMQAVHLPALVEEMTSLLQSSVNKKVSLQLDVAKDLPAISGDSSQIRQIVMNLIINASEAIGNAGGRITVRIGTNTFTAADGRRSFFGDPVPPGTYACLEVIDDGCGMDEETCRRIFEPFFTTKVTGRGLGMSAVLGIIRSHQGFLDLWSEPGKGTEFRVHFPVAGLREASSEERPSSPRTVQGSGKAVLVVDDEEMVREVCRELLKTQGFTVHTAAHGREAVELIRRHPGKIDLMLLDMNMPILGGPETLAEIRRTAPGMPVLLCSGDSPQEIMARFPNDRNLGFLYKPYSLDALIEAVSGILAPGGRA